MHYRKLTTPVGSVCMAKVLSGQKKTTGAKYLFINICGYYFHALAGCHRHWCVLT